MSEDELRERATISMYEETAKEWDWPGPEKDWRNCDKRTWEGFRRITDAVLAETERTHALVLADGITPDGLARLRAVVKAAKPVWSYGPIDERRVLRAALDAVTDQDMGR